ncbi:hypothetical protein Tco_0308100 [Tanacetum coccineum]
MLQGARATASMNDVPFVFGDSTPIDGNALTEDTDGGVTLLLMSMVLLLFLLLSTASRNVSTPIESFLSTGEAEFVNVVPNQAATKDRKA